MENPRDICFAAEKTLGKLTKWLRILGFDTINVEDISDGKFDEKERILLTRMHQVRTKKESDQLVFIKSDHSSEQLREVFNALGIIRGDICPFSRCIRCNTAIDSVEKDSVRGKVPDYIWENHDTFRMCRQCNRIYWPGSHTERSRDRIQQLFELN